MNSWLFSIFEAQAVRKGGVVRRSKYDVAEYSSYGALLAEVKRRQFHLIEVGDQYIIICNPGHLRVHS